MVSDEKNEAMRDEDYACHRAPHGTRETRVFPVRLVWAVHETGRRVGAKERKARHGRDAEPWMEVSGGEHADQPELPSWIVSILGIPSVPQAPQGLDLPCPLAGFAQVPYRAISRESKPENGLWGRWTRGEKAKSPGYMPTKGMPDGPVGPVLSPPGPVGAILSPHPQRDKTPPFARANSASTRALTSAFSTRGGAWCGFVRPSITIEPRQPQALCATNAPAP